MRTILVLSLLASLAAGGVVASSSSAPPSLCDLGQVVPKYFYFQSLDAYDMDIVTTTCSALWNGNCTVSRVPGYSLWKVCLTPDFFEENGGSPGVTDKDVTVSLKFEEIHACQTMHTSRMHFLCTENCDRARAALKYA